MTESGEQPKNAHLFSRRELLVVFGGGIALGTAAHFIEKKFGPTGETEPTAKLVSTPETPKDPEAIDLHEMIHFANNTEWALDTPTVKSTLDKLNEAANVTEAQGIFSSTMKPITDVVFDRDYDDNPLPSENREDLPAGEYIKILKALTLAFGFIPKKLVSPLKTLNLIQEPLPKTEASGQTSQINIGATYLADKDQINIDMFNLRGNVNSTSIFELINYNTQYANNTFINTLAYLWHELAHLHQDTDSANFPTGAFKRIKGEKNYNGNEAWGFINAHDPEIPKNDWRTNFSKDEVVLASHLLTLDDLSIIEEQAESFSATLRYGFLPKGENYLFDALRAKQVAALEDLSAWTCMDMKAYEHYLHNVGYLPTQFGELGKSGAFDGLRNPAEICGQGYKSDFSPAERNYNGQDYRTRIFSGISGKKYAATVFLGNFENSNTDDGGDTVGDSNYAFTITLPNPITFMDGSLRNRLDWHPNEFETYMFNNVPEIRAIIESTTADLAPIFPKFDYQTPYRGKLRKQGYYIETEPLDSGTDNVDSPFICREIKFNFRKSDMNYYKAVQQYPKLDTISTLV